MHKLHWDFEIQTDHLISARKPDLVEKKKETCQIVNFAVPAVHRLKLKESEKRDKYLDLAKELKRLWHMKVTVIVIGAFETIPKGLVKRLEDFEIRGKVVTIQITALLELDRILRRVLEN